MIGGGDSIPTIKLLGKPTLTRKAYIQVSLPHRVNIKGETQDIVYWN